jgi:hypothetical protein
VSGALGAAAIVTMVVLSTSGLSAGPEFVVDRAENAVNDQAGKGWGEGVALRKAILLDEEVERAIWAVKETAIGVFVH